MKSLENFNFNVLQVHFSFLSPSFRRWLETYSILRVGANFVAYVGEVGQWMYCSREKGPAGCVFKKSSLWWECELKAMVGGHAICESRMFHTRKGITFSSFKMKNLFKFVRALKEKLFSPLGV